MDSIVYHVGDIEGGGRLLSQESVTPQEGVEVWLEADPDNKLTFDAADAAHSVEWLMEPVPADGTPQQASVEYVDPMGFGADASPDELFEEAERRVATIEGMVADVILADVQDETFLGEPEDEDPGSDDSNDDEGIAPDAKAASAMQSAKEGSVVDGLAGMLHRAVVAAAIAAEEVKDAEADGDEADGDEADGEADPGVEFAERMEALMGRVSKIEEEVARLLDTQMQDSELVEIPDEDADTVVVEGESEDEPEDEEEDEPEEEEDEPEDGDDDEDDDDHLFKKGHGKKGKGKGKSKKPF